MNAVAVAPVVDVDLLKNEARLLKRFRAVVEAEVLFDESVGRPYIFVTYDSPRTDAVEQGLSEVGIERITGIREQRLRNGWFVRAYGFTV